MHIDWISILIGWVGGIPSGLLANWLFVKLTRRQKGQYFTVTYESGRVMHFEYQGQAPKDVSVDETIRQLFGMEQGGNSTN